VGYLTAVSVLSLVGGSADGVAHFAHLGGFAAGFLYLTLDHRLTSRVDRLKKFVSRRRLDVASGSGGESGSGRPPRRPRRREDRVLDEVDRVLDKISESGLQSLSEEELELLDRVSKKYRQN
jgi:hypothetical protein